MKVKRFEAPDTKSALALVKDELGPDAVILSTKTLPREPGRAPVVEVVAAVDFAVENVVPRAHLSPAAPAVRRGAWRPPVVDRQGRPAALSADAEPAAGVNLSREARLLQQRFAGCNLDQQKRQSTNAMSVSPTPAPAPALNRMAQRSKARPTPEEVINWRNQILEQLAVRPLQLNGRTEPLVIALVGPTGVGKTTTAAKIAAWFSLHENARVALLSMDCYRIGATDQLRTYARIMRLPCEIVLRRQDLQAALHKHRQKDLIIIDTAGKSPFDEDHIPELGQWFADHGGITPYLVLSATAKKEDINHIIATYRPLGVPAAILTKLDETRAYAALCQQMARAELPIACLCTGQKVPEDFLPADKNFLKTLFGDGWDAAMRQQEAAMADDGWLS
ncbi:flagellar biosynthesis protein FlhF [Desulfurivibrio alkaliphilus]|uniref:Flagellar biosynthesis protein FlhF n=1 Tax=Desulfurivibrio alkaliphilus (strain DSM 19089 / UNIQEM U267 / AHT2) TaxID=589865 RepID=D6Z4E0_DESAT|nr:flagellar biosynthesis protein FlhF [Desulfurivibrio alkaliphilus]ADH86415.1 flagellar biosynthetic protein FlhF [Desulfurivibrio alkaliphilus AHT 2]